MVKVKLPDGTYMKAQTNADPAPDRLFFTEEDARQAILEERSLLIRYGYSEVARLLAQATIEEARG